MKRIQSFNDPIGSNVKNIQQVMEHVGRNDKDLTEEEVLKQLEGLPLWTVLFIETYGYSISEKDRLLKLINSIDNTINIDDVVLRGRFTGFNERKGFTVELGDEILIDVIKFCVYKLSNENFFLDKDEFEDWEKIKLFIKDNNVNESKEKGLSKLIKSFGFTINNNENLYAFRLGVKKILAISMQEVVKRKLECVLPKINSKDFFNFSNEVIRKVTGENDKDYCSLNIDNFLLLVKTFGDYKNNPRLMSDYIDNLIQYERDIYRGGTVKYNKEKQIENIITFTQRTWVNVKKEDDKILMEMFIAELSKIFKELETIENLARKNNDSIYKFVSIEREKFETYFLRESKKIKELKNVNSLNKSQDIEVFNNFESFSVVFENKVWRDFQRTKYLKTISGGSDTRIKDSLSKLDFDGFLNRENTNVVIKDIYVNEKTINIIELTVINTKNENYQEFKEKVQNVIKTFMGQSHSNFQKDEYMALESSILMKMDIKEVKSTVRKVGVKF